jgi:hypothetical protein
MQEQWMQSPAIFAFQLVTTSTANDVTTASIPSTAGLRLSAHCRQQIQMAQLQVIPISTLLSQWTLAWAE